MRFPERILSSFKRYPYRERLPLAVMMICILTWDRYSKWRTSFKWPPDEYEFIALIFYAALCSVLFFDRKGRPFWFLWGIIVGTGLVAALPWLHTLLGGWPRSR